MILEIVNIDLPNRKTEKYFLSTPDRLTGKLHKRQIDRRTARKLRSQCEILHRLIK